MAQSKIINQQIADIVRRFVRHIEGKGYPVRRAVLFGSWAKGKATKDSDIDVCLVSTRFGRDEFEEMSYLLRESDAIDNRIEPIPISVGDYDTDATPFIMEIKKYGKIIDVNP